MYICSCVESPQDFCSTSLSNTHYAPGTLGINVNPDDLKDEIKKIRNLQEFVTCIELINILDCIIRYPACNSSSQKLIPICQSQCLLIEAQMPQCLLHLENNLLMSDFPMVEELLRSVDCDNPESYYNFPSYHIETNSTDCLMIGELILIAILTKLSCYNYYICVCCNSENIHVINF